MENHSSWLGKFDDKVVSRDEEELLVFGYSCKLFRDDDRALRVDQGKYLIPWMGDDTHKIDRYDVRGYLNDLSLYEANSNNDALPKLSDEEQKIEQLCEEERYFSLYHNQLSEEDIHHEEELHRLKAALAEDGSYHEIGFNYNDDKKEIAAEEADVAGEKEEQPFKLPQELSIPPGMQIPDTMKVHLIIEKTAAFVAQHGPQMEIVIKNKQSSNPQFQFLIFENPLNPYFKHLVTSIKTGRYHPKPTEEKGDSDSDDDNDYLHPSLYAAQSTSPVKIPDLPVFKNRQDDAYSKLVQNLKDKVQPQPQNYPGHGNYPMSNWPHLQGNYPNQGTIYGQPPPPGDEALYHAFSNSLGSDLRPDQVVTPPLEVQSIVDKMAEYVVRSGDDFEAVVRRKQDKRFEFLNPDNQYHTYYIYKKTIFSEQKRLEMQQKMYEEAEREKKEKLALSMQNQYMPTESSGPVSFSLKSKESDLKDVKPSKLTGDSDDESLKQTQAARVESKAEGPSVEFPVVQPKATPRKTMFDVPPAPGSSYQIVPTLLQPTIKKITAESLEAKIAGEKLRDRLAAAARDKMAQQTRERLLQQERKRKAALFLNMIKSTPYLVKSSNETKSLVSADADNSPSKKQIVFGPHLENSMLHSENGKTKDREKSPTSKAKDSSRSSKAHSRSYERSLSPPSSSHKSRSLHHNSESHRRKSYHKSSYDHSSKVKTPPSAYSSHRSRSRSRSTSPKRQKGGRSKSRDRSSRRYDF